MSCSKPRISRKIVPKERGVVAERWGWLMRMLSARSRAHCADVGRQAIGSSDFEKPPKLFYQPAQFEEIIQQERRVRAEQFQSAAAMKLNVKNIRYLSADDWRVLTAVRSPIPALPWWGPAN